jgi:hypothetical protein
MAEYPLGTAARMIRVAKDETGEVSEVELTAEEIAQRAADAAAWEAEQAAIEADKQAKAEAKAELLAKLGISEDEAKLLLA